MVAKLLRRISTAILVAALIVGSYPILPTASAQSEPVCDELYYSNNDILYYNPCETSCSSVGVTSTLEGVDNAEKIWNFFAAKGLKPVAIAGIMGNFSQESTLDPAIKQNETTAALPDGGDGVTGYGLAQWTWKSRQANLFTAMRTAGLGKYYGAGWGAREVNKTIPAADLEKLLEVQLTYAWEGDSTKISSLADRLNALTSVEGDGGSAVIFHNLYENSSDNAAEIEERVADARTLLQRYGSMNTPGGGACKTGVLGGVKTLEDAIPWAKKFVADTQEKYKNGPVDASGVEMQSGTNPKFIYNFGHKPRSGVYCWGAADCGQCVAASGWFATTQTTDNSFLHENGGYIVDKYERAGLPTGTEPRPWSIFSAKSSSAGHTGVVLGVLENGEVITLEANFDSSGAVGVWQGNIQKRYAGKDLKFAYFDDRLSGDAVNAAGR